MADELIDSYIDRAGIQGDTDFVLKNLNEVLTKFNQLQGIKVSFEGAKNFRDAGEAAKAYGSTIGNINVLHGQLIDVNGRLIVSEQEKARLAKENTNTSNEQVRTERSLISVIEQKNTASKINARDLIENKERMRQYNAEVVANVKQQVEQQGYIDQLIAKLKELQRQYNALSEADLNGSVGIALAGDIAGTETELFNATRQLEITRQLAREQNLAEGAIARTREEINRLTKAYELLSPAARQSQEGVAMKTRLDELKAYYAQVKDGEKYEAQLLKEREKKEKQMAREAAEAAKLANAYEQLKIKEREAFATAAALGAQYGVNSDQFKEAQLAQQGYYQSLLQIETALGRSQRNVGNYTQATFALTQVIREVPNFAQSAQIGFLSLSNNLPMLQEEFSRLRQSVGSFSGAMGIMLRSLLSWNTVIVIAATLLTAFGSEITKAIGQLFSAEKSIESITLEMQEFEDVTERITNRIKTLASELEYIQKIGKINLEIAFGAGSSTDLIDLRSRSIEITGEIDKLQTDLTTAQDNYSKAFEAATRNRSRKDQEAIDRYGGDIKLAYAELSDEGKVMADAVNKSYETVEMVNNTLINKRREQNITYRQIELTKINIQKEAAEEAKKNGEKNAKELEALMQRELKAQFELKKLVLQYEIELQKAFAENNIYDRFDQSFIGADARSEARRIQMTKEVELLELSRDFELSNTKLTQSERELIIQKSLIAIRNAKTAAANDIIAIRKSVLDSEKEQMAEIEAFAKGEIDKDVNKQVESLAKSFEWRQRAIADNAEKELQIAFEQYQKGEINKEEYEQRKLEIENDTRRESLEAEIKYYEDLAAIVNLDPVKAAEYQKKLNEIKAKLRKEDLTDAEKHAMQQQAIQKRLNDKMLELANELRGVAEDFYLGALEKEKNEIQGQIDALERKKQKDIEVARQTIVNAQERTNAIVEIEAVANAQREVLEQKQRQLQVKKAEFEKQMAIANIIQNTTIAVMGALKPDGITTLAQRVTMAAVIGAIGAAQLARAIATPVPKYFRGRTKNDPYEGPAVVGDGGKREMIIRKEGAVEITPASDTLTYVRKGDVILPDADAVSTSVAMQFASTKTDSVMTNAYLLKQPEFFQPTAITGPLGKKLDKLTNAVKNKPTIIHNDISHKMLLHKYGRNYPR